jgi:hypothetical protein
MNEIEQVANIADKYGIKVIYDNHQCIPPRGLKKRDRISNLHFLRIIPKLYPMNSGGKRGTTSCKALVV